MGRLFLNAGNDMVAETDALATRPPGRTTKVTSKDSADTELANVAYTYEAMGNMTEIARGDGMKYALAYNAFGNLESIGVVVCDRCAIFLWFRESGTCPLTHWQQSLVGKGFCGKLVALRWRC